MHNYLSRFYLGDKQFEQVAHLSSKQIMKNLISEDFCNLKGPKHNFEYFFVHMISKIEKNRDYRIVRLDDDFLRFQTRPNPQIQEYFSPEIHSNINVCFYIKGFAESLLNVLGYPNCHVEKTKCCSIGDECCEYDIYFDHLNYFKL